MRKGQAILEYILMIVMISIVVAIAIRNTNETLYNYWSALTQQVSAPCPNCDTDQFPAKLLSPVCSQLPKRQSRIADAYLR